MEVSMNYLPYLQIIWDYLCLHQEPTAADCIVGFGNFNTNIARRAAQLYLEGIAPKILFTGGLGRNTEGLLPEPEAIRFAKVAMECGVPEEDIILEDKSTNTKENILFTKQLLEALETRPEYRRRGYAEQLIKAVLVQLQPERLYSHIGHKNVASIAVHLKCGFRKLADTARYLDGSVDAHCGTYLYNA